MTAAGTTGPCTSASVNHSAWLGAHAPGPENRAWIFQNLDQLCDSVGEPNGSAAFKFSTNSGSRGSVTGNPSPKLPPIEENVNCYRNASDTIAPPAICEQRAGIPIAPDQLTYYAIARPAAGEAFAGWTAGVTDECPCALPANLAFVGCQIKTSIPGAAFSCVANFRKTGITSKRVRTAVAYESPATGGSGTSSFKFLRAPNYPVNNCTKIDPLFCQAGGLSVIPNTVEFTAKDAAPGTTFKWWTPGTDGDCPCGAFCSDKTIRVPDTGNLHCVANFEVKYQVTLVKDPAQVNVGAMGAYEGPNIGDNGNILCPASNPGPCIGYFRAGSTIFAQSGNDQSPWTWSRFTGPVGCDNVTQRSCRVEAKDFTGPVTIVGHWTQPAQPTPQPTSQPTAIPTSRPQPPYPTPTPSPTQPSSYPTAVPVATSRPPVASPF